MVENQMAENQIRFEDGAGYERMMGTWSRLVGEKFLDWLAAPPGLRWIDVGCGSGAFSELVVERCAPAEVQGIDPSEGQLAFARKRPAARFAEFRLGNATQLPFPARRFDAAVMALVIFFLPDPAQGVAEMARVVGGDGLVAAYAWDMLGGGFPVEPIHAELRAVGINPLRPPSPDASRLERLRQLWTDAGLTDIETRDIAVQRTFLDFNDFWTITLSGSSVAPTIAAMAAPDVDRLKQRVRARVAKDARGRITYGARANAVKGRVPK